MYVYLTAYVYTVYQEVTLHLYDYKTHCDRHAERVARSLSAYRPRQDATRKARRLRHEPGPLVALAQWLAARRRPAAL